MSDFAQVSLQAERVAKDVWQSGEAEALAFTLKLIDCNRKLGRREDAERLIGWPATELRMLARELNIDIVEFMDIVRSRRLQGPEGKGSSRNFEDLVSRIKSEQE